MFLNQVVLNLSPSISGKVTTVSEYPSRGATNASGPWLLSIRIVGPGAARSTVGLDDGDRRQVADVLHQRVGDVPVEDHRPPSVFDFA